MVVAVVKAAAVTVVMAVVMQRAISQLPILQLAIPQLAILHSRSGSEQHGCSCGSVPCVQHSAASGASVFCTHDL